VQCYATGDEYNSRLHDRLNFTIVKEPSTGYYVYAVTADGDLVPTAYIVGRIDPVTVGLTAGEAIAPSKMLERRKALIAEDAGSAAIRERTAPHTGTINNLVIFIRFSDQEEFADSVSKYDDRFNATTGNSLRNYFRECSYNALTITSTFYPQPSGPTIVSYQDEHPRGYYMPYDASSNPIGYGGGEGGVGGDVREYTLLKSAVTYVAGQIPPSLAIDNDADGYVDNVAVIVSGSPAYPSALLWPHCASLDNSTSAPVYLNGKRVSWYNLLVQSRTEVGLLCHEMFHSLGAPDLYHSWGGGNPVGWWDLMGYDSTPPQHTGAYMKMKYGKWITAIPQITSPGIYSLNPLTSPVNNCYRIASPYSMTEYFVVEYRKWEGTFESSVPWQGLLVYRINPMWSGNQSGRPDEVYIYRPDGTPTSDGNDHYAPLSSDWGRTSINDTTNPYSFLSDGSPGGLNISEVGAIGATISFKVSFGDPPSISSISPSLKTVGEQGFMLDVYGANFFPTSVVRFNGNDRVTTYTSTTHLQAAILAQDVAAQGKYPVTVFSPGPGISNADTLTAVPGLPPAPVLTSPSNGAYGVAQNAQLLWNEYAGATSFRVQVATDSFFIARVFDDSTLTSNMVAATNLTKGMTYYWRVRTKNPSGNGPWSDVWRFTTMLPPPGIVALLAPVNNAVIGADSIRLVWSKAFPEVTGYRLDVATDSGFVSGNTDSSVTDTSKIIRLLVSGQVYFWRIRAKNISGWGESGEVRRFHAVFVGVADADVLPTEIRLEQNYPNPFNPGTTIKYELPKSSEVRVSVFDMLGREVSVLVNERREAGVHEVKCDGSNLSTGVYFYRLQAGDFVQSKKLILLK
jgi:M6 family metalloprotease-like protein